MRKTIVRILAVCVGLSLIVMAYCFYRMFTGPRMKEQPHILAYQTYRPAPPQGIIPVVEYVSKIPDPNSNPNLHNPLEANAENLERGRVYYGYYCVFCHGKTGDGYGPVGFSYNPVPADLRTTKVKEYSDAKLLWTSFKGVGHDPVLEKTVPEEYRWYIMLYVRELNHENLSVSPIQTTSGSMK